MGATSSKPPGTKDLSVNNTVVQRLFTRLALHTTARFYKYEGVCVPISRKLILKRGEHVTLTEAATMVFVATHTNIPVPRVHCAFTRKNVTYIVMERVPGQTFAAAWPTLSGPESEALFLQLRHLLEHMRALAPPGSAIQSCVRGPLFDSRIPQRPTFGPFPSTRDFHVWLREGLTADMDNPGHVSDKEWAEIMRMVAAQDQEWDEPPVFTHGDLSPFNIMVQNGKISAIIDWEFSGWLPRYL